MTRASREIVGFNSTWASFLYGFEKPYLIAVVLESLSEKDSNHILEHFVQSAKLVLILFKTTENL